MKLTLKRPDIVGALVNTLCIIHCLATPLLFIATASSLNHEYYNVPKWWVNLDFLFLLIASIAVYSSTKTTSKKIMKPTLWIFWFLLFLLIINEKITFVSLPEYFKYISASSLSVLHLYNLKYCNCKDDNCCIIN